MRPDVPWHRCLHVLHSLKYPLGLGAKRVPSTRRSIERISMPVAASGIRLIFAAFLGLSQVMSAETCTGPSALESKIHTQPNAEAFAALGIWFNENHKTDCAIETLQSGLKLEPGSERLFYLLGSSLYTAGRTQDAVAPL